MSELRKSKHLLEQLEARGIPEFVVDIVAREGFMSLSGDAFRYTMTSRIIKEYSQRGVNLKKYKDLRVVVSIGGTIITAYLMDKKTCSMHKLNKRR